jgi:hypothetical protein
MYAPRTVHEHSQQRGSTSIPEDCRIEARFTKQWTTEPAWGEYWGND